MSFRLRETDCKALECLAEYRILTVPQFAAILHKNKQAVRRRIGDLEKEGLIEVTKREFGRARGRPENLFGLTESAVDILKDKGILGRDVPYEKIGGTNISCIDHQLLLNWFRVHLSQIEQVLPRMTVKVLASNSPFLPRGQSGRIFITDCSPVSNPGDQGVKFTPDAVFGTRDSIAAKTCLFFLEVDCGTETIASPKRDMTDIRQKIVNYGTHFDSSRYKRYEDVFKCKLNGFRLLFLVNTPGRLVALCKLIQEMQSTDFVWLTEYRRMFDGGVSAAIWAKGGDLQDPQQSILGSLCCRAPLPQTCISKFCKIPP
ncbi:replication-relaxation family protein [Planctomycetota bacterium]